MMAPATSLPLPGDIANCFFSHSSLTALPWGIQHYSTTPNQLKAYSTQHMPSSSRSPQHPAAVAAPNSFGHHDTFTYQQRQQQQPQNVLTGKKRSTRKTSKSSYKHVPHKDKPPHLVARRNARERRRVQAVNSAFARLRKCVPIENRSKRLSKVKTLHRAIEYINGLQNLLKNAAADGESLTPPPATAPRHGDDDEDDAEDEDEDFHVLDDYLESDVEFVNKENTERKNWLPIRTECDAVAYQPYISCYENYSGSLTS